MGYKRFQKHRGNKKTVHNQHKPFNPKKYGELWASIGFQHDWDRTPQGDANGPVIGKLVLGSFVYLFTLIKKSVRNFPNLI